MSTGKEEKEKEVEDKSQSCGATGGDMAGTEDSDEESLTGIQRMMERMFGLQLKSKDEHQRKEEKASKQLLDEVTFDGIAKYIQSDKCKNIVVMAGAGISTAAGIPDFRSPGTGLYDNLQQYNLPYPEAIFDIDFFHKKPEPFFKLAKELYPGNFKATTTHYFIRLLNEKGLLLRHYTQNIDTLERVAGIPGKKLVEAHGEVFADKIPICEDTSCGGVVKPDIVFFGESLPERFSRLLSKDMPKCDLLIIMGTSLAVQPFASLVNHVRSTTPRLLINREKCGHSQAGNFFLYGNGSGLNFDDPKNYRDVAWLGSCDDGCIALADLLGWKEELVELVAKEHKEIDEKNKEGDGHLNKKDKSGEAEEKKITTKEADKSKENRTEENSEFNETRERNTDESGKAIDLENRKELDKKQGDKNGES